MGRSEQRVQERAYTIWEGEGRPDGRDLAHWFQAEVEISSTFPENDFRAFTLAANAFFPELLSDEALFDQWERRRHFDWSCQAVRYRHRLCTGCHAEFKALLADPSESWQAGWVDEELNYKIDRCIYVFFMSALSIIESFVFGLYFLGNAIHPKNFPYFNAPKKLNLAATGKSFTVAFPQAAITRQLVELPKKPEYTIIDTRRNILAHRISGRRSVQTCGTTHADGTYTQTRKETWHVPGFDQEMPFGEGLLQRHLDDITGLLSTLASASREFAENNQP
jgi:Protein of unknown function (DUF2934)